MAEGVELGPALSCAVGDVAYRVEERVHRSVIHELTTQCGRVQQLGVRIALALRALS